MESREEYKDIMVECLYAGCSVSIDHNGIKGSKGHHICPGCAPEYIQIILENHDTLIPVKGFDQRGDGKVDFDDIEPFMDDNQIFDYNIYACENSIKAHEKRIRCSNTKCSYFELRSKDDNSNLFYCKNEEGLKGTGLAGNNEFKYPKDPKNLTPEEK